MTNVKMSWPEGSLGEGCGCALIVISPGLLVLACVLAWRLFFFDCGEICGEARIVSGTPLTCECH